jgi:hypothetical protein
LFLPTSSIYSFFSLINFLFSPFLYFYFSIFSFPSFLSTTIVLFFLLLRSICFFICLFFVFLRTRFLLPLETVVYCFPFIRPTNQFYFFFFLERFFLRDFSYCKAKKRFSFFFPLEDSNSFFVLLLILFVTQQGFFFFSFTSSSRQLTFFFDILSKTFSSSFKYRMTSVFFLLIFHSSLHFIDNIWILLNLQNLMYLSHNMFLSVTIIV